MIMGNADFGQKSSISLFCLQNLAIAMVGHYDFHDAEICQSLDELIKSRSLHLSQIAIWTSICKY